MAACSWACTPRGMALPAALLALLWDRLRLGQRRLLRARPLQIGRWSITSSQAAAGLLFLAIGVLMIATDGTSDLGGMLTAQQDIGVEAWLRATSSPITDAVVIGALAAAITLGTLTALLRRRLGNRSASGPLEPGRAAGDQGEDLG